MTLLTRNLIIDTQYFVTKSFDFDSSELRSLIDLATKGLVEVFLTDITEREIRKKIRDEVATAYGKIQSSDARVIKNIPAFREFLQKNSASNTIDFIEKKFDEFLEKAGVQILSSENVNLIDIFEDYCNSQVPFDRKNKKNEFPDSFAMATIDKWATGSSARAYILSDDPDWKAFCEARGYGLYTNITELSEFTDLVLRTENQLSDLVAFADSLIDKNKEEYERAILQQLNQENCVSDNAYTSITDNYFLSAKLTGKELITVDREKAVYNLAFEVEGIFYYDIEDHENTPWDPESGAYVFDPVYSSIEKQRSEMIFQVEIAFEDGLESNYQLMSIVIPAELEIPYEGGDVINPEEWILQLPVRVVGVEDGKVTEDGSGEMEFLNLAEAKEVFPLLDINQASGDFSKASGNRISEPLVFRAAASNR